MDTFFKLCSGVLVAALLALTLQKQEKDISLLLVCLVCCMVLTAAAEFLKPVVDFLDDIRRLTNMDSEAVTILLKSVGIGLVGEITCAICTDSGNAALGKALQIAATTLILWLSLPLFTGLIELVEEVLKGI